jgi:peptidyl-prolyl cis-trans isomerase D
MMKFLRSQSQTVLWTVIGVIALGFLFYGNAGNLLTSNSGRISNDFGRIDGQDLTVAQLTDAIRNTRDAIMLEGQPQLLAQPGASVEVAEEAWRQLLLLNEADKLHIDISNKELVDYIHSMPVFQGKDGVYSPDAYEKGMAQLKNVLHVQPDAGVDPIANTKAIFETVLRNNLKTDAVKKALFANIHGSAKDVSDRYQKYYAPVTASVVSFDPKTFVAQAKVTPDEIAAEYKANPQNPDYRTQEKRKVDYVLFPLSPDQAKLPDAQKTAAKNELGQKALDFALAFQPDPSASTENPPPAPDFAAEAKKRGLNPATTDFFSADQTPAGIPPSPAFNNAAFSLSKDDAISKVVELDNGVAVLHLSEIQPSDLRPLDEVKGDITKKLQQTEALRMARASADVTSKALQAALAKGADFKTTAKGMKLKVETVPSFVPAKTPQSDPRLQTIAFATTSLKTGEVSDPVPMQTDNSLLVVHLDSRGQADPAGLAQFETRAREQQDQQMQAQAYSDWAIWKSKQAGTHKPPELDAYGAVE